MPLPTSFHNGRFHHPVPALGAQQLCWVTGQGNLTELHLWGGRPLLWDCLGVVWGGQVPARWAICTQTAIFLCSSKQRPVIRRGSIPPSERINWLRSRTSWGRKRKQSHQHYSYVNCCPSEVLCWSSRCAQSSVQSRTRMTSYTFGCRWTASDFCLPSLCLPA